MVTRKDLTDDEWDWLLRIYQHRAAMLTVSMDKRLAKLGLVEGKLGGTGVSAAGKKLVETELAPIIAARRRREPGH
ncbi:hypothetical protein [Mesorhizobium sp. CO1-1-9]|uniref:hypothetical protein n=1 Tax=Mesorhizobium sp. CO1-1-9 TaxID=2876630 RepID=UPI001CC91181|nr:hypothetical protein [Mesorhizobium sp. CO1-1-9]MBZ9694544.1 hypothetical protein [Mesorhizobium sp. CO1-1-9]